MPPLDPPLGASPEMSGDVNANSSRYFEGCAIQMFFYCTLQSYITGPNLTYCIIDSIISLFLFDNKTITLCSRLVSESMVPVAGVAGLSFRLLPAVAARTESGRSASQILCAVYADDRLHGEASQI